MVWENSSVSIRRKADMRGARCLVPLLGIDLIQIHPVQLHRIFEYDLASDVFRHTGEVFRDPLSGFRPGGVGVREI